MSWFTDTVLIMISHAPAWALIDSGSLETKKKSHPFSWANFSLFALDEIATTLWPSPLASLIPIEPRPPIPIIPTVL